MKKELLISDCGMLIKNRVPLQISNPKSAISNDFHG